MTITRICRICRAKKPTDEFHLRKESQKYLSECKICSSNISKEYCKNNAEKVKARRKKHYDKNRDIILAKKKEDYKNNRDRHISSVKKWQSKNKDKIRDYQNKRRKENPEIRLRQVCSRAIHQGLKSKNSYKSGASILDYLPYSMKELKAHLKSQFEKWMNWNNYGRYYSKTWNDIDSSTWTWQIDHIIPCSSFNYTSMNDASFLNCWSLSNLRPYSAKQNIRDGNRR